MLSIIQKREPVDLRQCPKDKRSHDTSDFKESYGRHGRVVVLVHKALDGLRRAGSLSSSGITRSQGKNVGPDVCEGVEDGEHHVWDQRGYVNPIQQ